METSGGVISSGRSNFIQRIFFFIRLNTPRLLTIRSILLFEIRTQFSVLQFSIFCTFTRIKTDYTFTRLIFQPLIELHRQRDEASKTFRAINLALKAISVFSVVRGQLKGRIVPRDTRQKKKIATHLLRKYAFVTDRCSSFWSIRRHESGIRVENGQAKWGSWRWRGRTDSVLVRKQGRHGRKRRRIATRQAETRDANWSNDRRWHSRAKLIEQSRGTIGLSLVSRGLECSACRRKLWKIGAASEWMESRGHNAKAREEKCVNSRQIERTNGGYKRRRMFVEQRRKNRDETFLVSRLVWLFNRQRNFFVQGKPSRRGLFARRDGTHEPAENHAPRNEIVSLWRFAKDTRARFCACARSSWSWTRPRRPRAHVSKIGCFEKHDRVRSSDDYYRIMRDDKRKRSSSLMSKFKSRLEKFYRDRWC